MIRYAIRTKALCEDTDIYGYRFDKVPVNAPIVDMHNAVATGLVNADGHEIMRLPNPIGFIWND